MKQELQCLYHFQISQCILGFLCDLCVNAPITGLRPAGRGTLIAAQYALAVPTSATRRKISLDKSVQAPGKVLI